MVCVWIGISGRIDWHGATSGRVEAPGIVVLSEAQIDGVDGARPWVVRSFGPPFCSVEVRLPTSCCLVDCAAGPSPRSVPESLTRAAAAYAAATRVEAEAFDPYGALQKLLDEFVRAGIVSAGVHGMVSRDIPPELTRVWNKMVLLVDDFRRMPPLKELATATGLSLRTIARTVPSLPATLALRPGGWRDSTLYVRLAIASAFLSVPGMSVAEVALRLGYTNVQALTNAFQRAGMPRPSEYAKRVETWPE